jgi:hypothetical protein
MERLSSSSIGLFWNNAIKIEILPYSQYHLDTVVTEQGQDQWRLTMVYGKAQVSERHKTWDMLKFMRSSNDLDFLVVCGSVDDFNEVLHDSQHEGVNEWSYRDTLKFIHSSNDLDPLDVCGSVGDFDEVLDHSEHEGVNERRYGQMAGFRDIMDVCGLYDLGYKGVGYTFEKKVAGGSYCRTRLNQALATLT